MSSHLSKDLKAKYNVRSIPVRKGDTVQIMRGFYKGKSGKVQTVYRRRWCVYVEKLVKEKVNGQQAQIPFDASNLKVTALRLDADRKSMLARKQRKTDAKKSMQKLDWALTWVACQVKQTGLFLPSERKRVLLKMEC